VPQYQKKKKKKKKKYFASWVGSIFSTIIHLGDSTKSLAPSVSVCIWYSLINKKLWSASSNFWWPQETFIQQSCLK
jgi:hypothetical protein